jgi:ribosomal protein L11 methyltransferase
MNRDNLMNWVEVSLTVNGELAEAVADVLARSAPNGVTTEQAVDFVNDEDEGTPTGPITVRAYLPADERLEETRQRLEEGLYFLGMIQPLPAAVFTPIADQNWMEAWKERYHPIPIGKKLIIVPAWLESPDAGRVSIKIDPGMAFGTGTHPSTQLCLELIEDICDQIPSAERASQAAIDVGCGSGILSIGALKLGMGFALGVDIDEASVRASRENADTNAIAPERFAIGLGSVTEILEGKFQVKQARLVLANILAPVIIRLFGMGLADLVAVDGALVLAGILTDQAESVQTCAEQHGLRFVQKHQMGDWVALMFAH